jgi:carbon storage regulator
MDTNRLVSFRPKHQGGMTMLVLTRRIGEEIIIHGNISVVIVAIEGGRVRLGVRAPSEVVIDRREIHDRRKEFEALPRRRRAYAK